MCEPDMDQVWVWTGQGQVRGELQKLQFEKGHVGG